MFRKFTFAALTFSFVAALPFASADSFIAPQFDDANLSYLSVHVAETAAQGQPSTLLGSTPDAAPRSRPVFSASQAKLMQDLSKAIDVIPGGVQLCLNIHY